MKSIIKSKPKINKKGDINIVIFVVILLVVLIIGFIVAIGAGAIDFLGDEITPVFQELGVVGDTNLSQVASYTVTPLNTVIQSLTWLTGFAYVGMLIFSIAFIVTYRINPHPVFIGAYFLFVVLIIFAAIALSNMYEDIYTGSDEISTRLQEQTLLSYMILYSPVILAIIGFISGIFLFARPADTSAGGFGV